VVVAAVAVEVMIAVAAAAVHMRVVYRSDSHSVFTPVCARSPSFEQASAEEKQRRSLELLTSFF
jgi:hypothetical protein